VELTPAFIVGLADEARTNHPALRAAAARVNAAVANERSVRTWDDPMIEVGGMAAERMMRAEDGDLIYSVDQKLPLFGKPQAERQMARAEARVGEAEATARFQQLRRDIAIAAFRTALADRTFGIGQQDLLWLETQVAAVERRYETGGATQFDVLRLQNERTLRQTRLETDRELLKHERVNLNRLLNRPLEAAWPALRLPPVAGPVIYSRSLADLAARYEPDLLMRHEQIHRAETSVHLARRQRYPDLAAGAELRNYTGNGELRQSMFTLSFNVPWGNWKHYNAAVKREQEKLKAAEWDAADFELGLRNDVHSLTVKIDAARREALTYHDQIIPRSEAALQSSSAAWETSRGMLRDVLDARRMLLDAQLMYARATAEQHQMLAELVLCCGLGDLEALQMIGVLPENNSTENKTNEK
jgi:outer membrane protein TolC